MKHTSRKRRRRFSRQTPPGAPPGVVAVDPGATPPRIHLIAYGPGKFRETAVSNFDEIQQELASGANVWVNVEGLGDAPTIERLGALFGLHHLSLEDVVNVHQRAKVELYESHLFIVARMVRLNDHLETEQVSLFLGKNFLVSFLEDPGDCFDTVRSRLRSGGERMIQGSTAFLAYSILDAVVDAYFPVVEAFGERMDLLEDTVLENPTRENVAQVFAIKQDLRVLRRVVWPMREMLNSLCRDTMPWIDAETRIHLRDCYDHTIQVMDFVETYRELASDLTDLYLSSLSQRLNEVMKVLTIISTLFMPLAFIAGVYGMNFETHHSPWNMPELRWRYGYPAVLMVMAVVAGCMLYFFYRRGWLRSATA